MRPHVPILRHLISTVPVIEVIVRMACVPPYREYMRVVPVKSAHPVSAAPISNHPDALLNSRGAQSICNKPRAVLAVIRGAVRKPSNVVSPALI